jgi:hypothetical protein
MLYTSLLLLSNGLLMNLTQHGEGRRQGRAIKKPLPASLREGAYNHKNRFALYAGEPVVVQSVVAVAVSVIAAAIMTVIVLVGIAAVTVPVVSVISFEIAAEKAINEFRRPKNTFGSKLRTGVKQPVITAHRIKKITRE